MMFVVCLRYRCTRQILHNPLYDLFTSNLLHPSGRDLFIISDIVYKLYVTERLTCGSGNEKFYFNIVNEFLVNHTDPYLIWYGFAIFAIIFTCMLNEYYAFFWWIINSPVIRPGTVSNMKTNSSREFVYLLPFSVQRIQQPTLMMMLLISWLFVLFEVSQPPIIKLTDQ